MKTFIFLIAACYSLDSYGFGGGKTSTPTPYKSVRGVGSSQYQSLVSMLEAIKRSGSISCNQSYGTDARAMVCNCANEAGNQSVEGMTAVSRVVLSRVKSSDFPATIKEVVCERRQFSWTIGGWSENCQRTSKRNLKYFNTPRVKGKMLANCVESSKRAAKLELVDSPKKLFALNYCSTNPKAYSNAIPRWCRNLMISKKPIDGHVFGFAGQMRRRSNPIRKSSKSISFFDFLNNFGLLTSKAYATSGDLKIVNTKSKKRVMYNAKIKEILKEKYKNFSPYAFQDYKKTVQTLMSETRNNLPASTIGDYNADGVEDLILMGSNQKKHMVIAFISQGRSYKDYVVSSEPMYKTPLNTYLVNIQKSKILFRDHKKRDALQIETFGGASVTKLFDGVKFVDNNPKSGFKFK